MDDYIPAKPRQFAEDENLERACREVCEARGENPDKVTWHTHPTDATCPPIKKLHWESYKEQMDMFMLFQWASVVNKYKGG